MPDVVVIGAGAAGIFAAWRAASLGADVLLLEKTSRIGTKILISGGGKCNVAHGGPLEDVLRAFRKNEALFIRPACYRLKNTDIIDMMVERGLEVYTRPDGRVFPVHQNAKDVVQILRDCLLEVGVTTRLDTPVTGLLTSNSAASGVICGDQTVDAERVIVSVGGMSYPNSGTTGDGWPWVTALGHTIVPPRAALAPIETTGTSEELSTRAGVALRDCILKARAPKEIARWRGDLLFTHRGISGPNALGISREVAEAPGRVDLEVDLQPDETFESLTDKLLAEAQQHPNRLLSSFLNERMPERLVAEFSSHGPTRMAKLEKAVRNRTVERLKAWPIGQVKTVPIDRGEVTAGGVSLNEVDPKTMESRLIRGLYLCGEMLDVAGPVGGYNLQAAFATGYVAGESAANASA